MSELKGFIDAAEVYFQEREGVMTREDFMKLIRQHKGSRLHFSERQIEHIDIDVFIIDKLKKGHERANIARRVMDLTGCCSSSAYNHIMRAMNKMQEQREALSECA